MGKREMDDEQRRRMRDLKRLTLQGVLIFVPVLVLSIVLGMYLRDDWTEFLFGGSMGLVMVIVGFVSYRRYIRRGPFPRLPASMRDDTTRDED